MNQGWMAWTVLVLGRQATERSERAGLSPLGCQPDVLFLDQRELYPEEPCFVGRSGSMRVGAIPGGMLLQLFSADACESAVVRLSFEGSDPSAELDPFDLQPGLYHFFLGDDPSKWRRNVRAYRGVRYRGLYPGIDLVLRGDGGGFEYDLVVAPGTDLSQVVVHCEGIESLGVDTQWGVVLETSLGPLHHPVGRTWQEREDGIPEALPLSYRRIDEERFGFIAPGRDWRLLLTIDPRLVWSTYLGGRGGGTSVGDIARSAALDREGNVTVAGTSEGGINGGGFPMTPGTFQSPAGLFEDVFVTRFRASTGALVYSSLIGEFTQEDRGDDVAVDATGRATVVGCTQSPDFPTTPGSWDPVKTGTLSGFVFRLSPLGEDLEYSTFLEGTLGSQANTVVVATTGAAIVGGETGSSDFPTTPGAFGTTIGGLGSDGFVTRLDPSGTSLEWSTFLGGVGSDKLFALAIDAQENIVSTGLAAPFFPTTNGAYQTVANKNGDAFVAHLDSTGSKLLWSTFLGGSNPDEGDDIAVASTGEVVVGGISRSLDFPTTPGTFQPNHTLGTIDANDVFLSRLDSTGSRLVFSTFIGGTSGDYLGGLSLDPSGVVTAVGWTTSGNDFPLTPGAFDTGIGKDTDGFVVRLDPMGRRLFYSSRIGGAWADGAEGMALGPTRRVTLVGGTQSNDYPTTPDAVQPIPPGGDADAVVTTMDLVLEGVQRLGPSAATCLGLLDLNATEMPVAGSQTFGLYCSGAPPSADGMLVVSALGGMSGGVQAKTGKLALAPPQLVTSVRYVLSDAAGYVEKGLPLPVGSSGAKLLCQFVFQNPPTCTGESPSSASNRLLLTVQ